MQSRKYGRALSVPHLVSQSVCVITLHYILKARQVPFRVFFKTNADEATGVPAAMGDGTANELVSGDQLFHLKVFLRSFYVLTIWVCTFLAKGFWYQSCS
jgi:hypothetical protein